MRNMVHAQRSASTVMLLKKWRSKAAPLVLLNDVLQKMGGETGTNSAVTFIPPLYIGLISVQLFGLKY